MYMKKMKFAASLAVDLCCFLCVMIREMNIRLFVLIAFI